MVFSALPRASPFGLTPDSPLPSPPQGLLLLWPGCGTSRSQYRGQAAGHCYSRPPSGSFFLLWHHAIRDGETKDDKWLVEDKGTLRKFNPLPPVDNWLLAIEYKNMKYVTDMVKRQIVFNKTKSPCVSLHTYKKPKWVCFHSVVRDELIFMFDQTHIDKPLYLSLQRGCIMQLQCRHNERCVVLWVQT